MTLHDLEVLQNADLKKIDRNMIIDIEDILIDQGKPKEERIKAFLQDTSNPYFVKHGNVLIRMSFSNDSVLIKDCIERYLVECLNDRL